MIAHHRTEVPGLETLSPMGVCAPSIQADTAHPSPPVTLQQPCRPGGPGLERGGEVVSAHISRFLWEACSGVSVRVSLLFAGTKATGSKTSLARPCFPAPTLRSWEGVTFCRS